MAKNKTSKMEEALAKAVESFEDNTGEVVTEEDLDSRKGCRNHQEIAQLTAIAPLNF